MSDCDSSGCNFGKSHGNDKFIPYDASLSKLLKDGFLCDVIIRVKNTTVPVHRVILSASSCFFHDLFNNVESINQEYDLTNVFIDPDKLDKILIYIYEGYVKINVTNIRNLLSLSNWLGISSLTNHCAQFLLSKLRLENAFETWQVAWKYNLKELANISQIVCRECMSDLLLGKNNVTILCEEFLSYALATEVMATLSPMSVLSILVCWISNRKYDNDKKLDKLLSLMDIYLSWKTLSKTELKDIIGNIRSCFQFDPRLSMSRLESWSRKICKNISQFSPVDGMEEDIDNTSNITRSLDYRWDWSLLAVENLTMMASIYCNTKSKWFSIKMVEDPLTVIGFFNNFLWFRYCTNTLILRNVQDMRPQILTSSTFADENSIQFIDAQDSAFFMHSNNIYSIDAVRRTTENDMICIINRYDQQRNEWVTVLRLNTELSNDILSVSLTVETSKGDDVYLFMTVGRSHKPGENTCESSAFKGKFVTNFGQGDATVFPKQLKMFYVFCINMKDFSYHQIGKRRNEPTDLNACRKIILQDKIIFLLDPDRDLERKFGYAYHKKNDCYLSCLQLLLDGENCWMSFRLRAPFPDVQDISIRKRGIVCFDCSVTSCKNLLFVGVHWSPHVFQVFKYDMSTLIVSSLPPISLPAIDCISINALLVFQPISDYIQTQLKFSDFLNLHYRDWSLLSWDGSLI